MLKEQDNAERPNRRQAGKQKAKRKVDTVMRQIATDRRETVLAIWREYTNTRRGPHQDDNIWGTSGTEAVEDWLLPRDDEAFVDTYEWARGDIQAVTEEEVSKAWRRRCRQRDWSTPSIEEIREQLRREREPLLIRQRAARKTVEQIARTIRMATTLSEAARILAAGRRSQRT